MRAIARPSGGILDPGQRAGLSADVLASFDLACILGWLVRSEEGPFAELFSSDVHFAERLGRDALAEYVRLLCEDYAGAQPYLVDGLRDAVTSLVLGGAKAQSGRVSSWELPFDSYGSYLVRKHRLGGYTQDWRADLVTLLLMAALLGPKDYRADLLIDMPEKYESTARDTEGDIPRAPIERSLDVERRCFLTRVTFDCEPPDETDWLMCQGEGGGTSSTADRLLSVCLEGKRRVVMARALPRYSDANGIVEIPLNCREASSKAHVELEFDGVGWKVHDAASTNGTLVVSRDGTRRLLYRKVEGGDEAVPLRNGDVICVAPNHRSGRAVATNPAFLFHMATTTWY